MYDVLIIGAGITGILVSRELARYQLNIAILERSNDVGNKTTSANSAIIHSGCDPEPGTNKAKFNILGNAMFDELTKQLDVEFRRNGSLTIALSEDQLKALDALEERSKINGVPFKRLSKQEVLALESHLSNNVTGALFFPTAGIIDPFNLSIHAMENAIDNGVHLFLREEVIDIKKKVSHYLVKTKIGEYKSKIVINAAGNHADVIAKMVEPIDWSIIPRKGEYFILDHFAKGFVEHTIFPLPSDKGKGVLISPTTSDNYIVGPSSEPILDKDDYSTDGPTLQSVRQQALAMVPSIPFGKVIRVFSGLRPSSSRHDFIIEYSRSDSRFINVAGIESPGLVSSPAIAQYVVNELVRPLISLKEKSNFNPNIRPYVHLNKMSKKEREIFVKENPEFAEMVCSCEKVSVGEIKDLLVRSCPPRSIKGVKRRTRAGFGRCQGGFCQPKILFLLANHYGVSPLEIPLDDVDSPILTSRIKEVK
jgi:glycerol-3-phosphate dehydrogenase